MYKKIPVLALAIILNMNTFAFANTAESKADTKSEVVKTEQSGLADHKVIQLSLEDAINKMMADSYKVEVAEINLKAAEAIAKEYDETYDKVDAGTKAPIGYGGTSTFDRDQVQLVRDFAETQGPSNYEAEINGLQLEVRDKYFTVLLANEIVNIRKENIKLQEESLKQAHQKYKLGQIAKNDLLQAELIVTKGKNELAKAEYDAKLAQMDFNIFLGYDILTQVQLNDRLEPIVYSEVSLDEGIALAHMNSNAVKGAKFGYEISKRIIEGYGVRYNKRSSTYLKAQADLLEAENLVGSTKELVELDVRKKYMDIVQGENNMNVMKASIENTKILLNSATVSYEYGQITYLELQQLQLLLLSQQLELADSIKEYNTAVDAYNTVLTVGTMTIDLDNKE